MCQEFIGGKVAKRQVGQSGVFGGPDPVFTSGALPVAQFQANQIGAGLVTANNAIITNDYPYFWSRDWDYGYRVARIVEQLEALIAAGPVTVESMSQLHMDTQFPVAASLQQAYAAIEVENDDVQQALDMLAEWEGQNDADSATAAYANVFWNHVTEAMMNTQDADIPRDEQSRLFEFFTIQLEDPGSTWWGESQETLLADAAEAAYNELVAAQGSDPKAGTGVNCTR